MVSTTCNPKWHPHRRCPPPLAASFHEPTVMRGPRNVGNKCRMAKQRAVRGSSTHPLHRNELRFPAPCDFPLNSISHSIRFPTQFDFPLNSNSRSIRIPAPFEFPLHSNSRSMRFRSMSSHPSTQLLQVDGCRNKKRSHDCRSQSHPSMTSLSVDLHS